MQHKSAYTVAVVGATGAVGTEMIEILAERKFPVGELRPLASARSAGDRVGINITYCLGWLRQEENQYLSCPPAIARTLDPKLQALLGYAMGSYALGYYTPPLPPGEGPEVVPPQFALGEAAATGWGEDLLATVTERQREKLKAAAE